MNIVPTNPFQSKKTLINQSSSLLRYGEERITLFNILLQDKKLIKNSMKPSVSDVQQNILKRYQIKMIQLNNQLPQQSRNLLNESKQKTVKKRLTNFQQTKELKSQTILINPFQTNKLIESNIEKNSILIKNCKDTNTVNTKSVGNERQLTRKQIMRLRNEIRQKEEQCKRKQGSVINLYKISKQPKHSYSNNDKHPDKSMTFAQLSSYSFKVPSLVE